MQAELLARILLTEGRHLEAYELAMAMNGATQVKLVTIVGSFYLAVSWPERPAAGSVVQQALNRGQIGLALPVAAAADEARDAALSRSAACYHRLVQIYVEARGRENYATAASYAAVLTEAYTRQSRRADFDHWYAGLMDTYRRFRALREEFRNQLGQEPRGGDLPAC